MSNTKKEVVSIINNNRQVVKGSLVGNHYWIVWKDGFKTKLSLVLMRCIKSQYEYKIIDEEHFLYYYDCPLYLLNFTNSCQDEGWRNRVRNYHLVKKQKRVEK